MSEKLEILTKWIPLITAIVSLITAVIGLNKSLQNEIMIKAIKDCRGEATITINSPTEGAQVGDFVDIIGNVTTTAAHEMCRYVCITVHDVSTPGKGWQIADLTQADITTGQWAGKIKLDKISIGSDVEIDARLNSQPNTCLINQHLHFPLEGGIPSNIVKVRRIQ